MSTFDFSGKFVTLKMMISALRRGVQKEYDCAKDTLPSRIYIECLQHRQSLNSISIHPAEQMVLLSYEPTAVGTCFPTTEYLLKRLMLLPQEHMNYRVFIADSFFATPLESLQHCFLHRDNDPTIVASKVIFCSERDV